MDGEADGSELKQTLDSLEDANDDLKGVWLRYHTYSAILRGEETTRVKRNHSWEALVTEFEGDINDGVPQPRILPFRSSYKNVVRNRWIVGASSAMAASLAIVLSWAVFLGLPESQSGSSVQNPIAGNETAAGPQQTQVANAGGEIRENDRVVSAMNDLVRERLLATEQAFDVLGPGTLQNDLQTVRYQLSQQDMEELVKYLQLRNVDSSDIGPAPRNSLQTVSSPNSN